MLVDCKPAIAADRRRRGYPRCELRQRRHPLDFHLDRRVREWTGDCDRYRAGNRGAEHIVHRYGEQCGGKQRSGERDCDGSNSATTGPMCRSGGELDGQHLNMQRYLPGWTERYKYNAQRHHGADHRNGDGQLLKWATSARSTALCHGVAARDCQR